MVLLKSKGLARGGKVLLRNKGLVKEYKGFAER